MTWTYQNKTETSWSDANKSGASIDYLAGKVGYSAVGRGRIGATTDGTISGTQWSYSIKS